MANSGGERNKRIVCRQWRSTTRNDPPVAEGCLCAGVRLEQFNRYVLAGHIAGATIRIRVRRDAALPAKRANDIVRAIPVVESSIESSDSGALTDAQTTPRFAQILLTTTVPRWRVLGFGYIELRWVAGSQQVS